MREIPPPEIRDWLEHADHLYQMGAIAEATAIHNSAMAKWTVMKEGLAYRPKQLDPPQELPRFNCAGNVVMPKTQGVTQMNHNEALAKLTRLEKEAKELRAILEKPERAPSLLSLPDIGSPLWQLTAAHFGSLTGQCGVCLSDVQYGGKAFQSEELVKAYAEAIDTMLLLRRHPGTRRATNKTQFVVEPTSKSDELYVENWSTIGCKSRLISPAFDTAENAQLAIDTIGEDRILRMFKVLHHVDN